MDIKSRNMIIDNMKKFQEFLKTEEGQEWVDYRQEHVSLLAELRNPVAIAQLDESGLERIMGSLWSNLMWPNIGVKMKMIFAENKMDTIRESLKDLLYGNAPMAERYDRFRDNVSQIGTSSITEILGSFDPREYMIWNERVKSGLRILGLAQDFPKRAMKYSQISGADYENCIVQLKEVLKSLQQNGKPEADFLDVHFFLAHVATEHSESEIKNHSESGPEEVSEWNHDEVVEMIASIGSNLGFEVDRKKKVARGAVVDVYWSAKVGNLGQVAYAFEVQKSGSVDSLILNLQRARNDPKVQRIVVVSDQPGLQNIRNEVLDLEGDFKRYLAYLDVRSLTKVSEMLTDVNEILKDLRLSESWE